MPSLKYKTKPVEIEALEWTGENHREMFNFLEGKTNNDNMNAYGDNFFINHNMIDGGLIIRTLEGDMTASIGDFIIKGILNEFYPCNQYVFHNKYQLSEVK